MYKYVESGMHITWKECCEVAIQDELSKYNAQTVMVWYRELTESLSQKFRQSERGQDPAAAKFPFAEDEMRVS
jgi:hypothetical protein